MLKTDIILWGIVLYEHLMSCIYNKLHPPSILTKSFLTTCFPFVLKPALIIQVLSWFFLPVYISAGVSHFLHQTSSHFEFHRTPEYHVLLFFALRTNTLIIYLDG